ncbi:MAG: aminotransferase class V-fold PLP-dependent enzyme, partial [Acidobacteriota bacterium]
GALLLADCVTSLAGHPLEVDEWGMDICFAGTQKCLNCPPGLAPLTASERAMQKLRARKSKVRSWYLDLSLLDNYWGENRSYHHTAPIAMNNALREALLIVQEDGLEARWDRHKRHHLALVAGIEAMGLKMHVDPGYRLWPLNTVRVPSGIDEAAVRARLLSKFNLEVGAGLGDLAGKVLRIGLMGLNSSMENVLIVLHALEECLSRQGYSCPPGAGVRAASEALV